MEWETIIKILGAIAGLIGSLYQIRQLNSLKRARLKSDLDILEKLEKGSESYNLLKKDIDNSIRQLYPSDKSTKLIQSKGEFIFGLVFVIGFTIWSVFIYYKSQGFSWWILLTAFFAMAGIGGIMNGLEKKKPSAVVS